MRIDRIIYQKAFVTGPFLQEKIGMEAQIDDGEDVQAKMLTLKNLVEDFHSRNNPGLVVQNGQEEYTVRSVADSVPFTYTNKSIPSIDRNAIEKLEIAIDNAPSIEELAKLKDEAGKQNLTSLYVKRLNQLINPEKNEQL